MTAIARRTTSILLPNLCQRQAGARIPTTPAHRCYGQDADDRCCRWRWPSSSPRQTQGNALGQRAGVAHHIQQQLPCPCSRPHRRTAVQYFAAARHPPHIHHRRAAVRHRLTSITYLPGLGGEHADAGAAPCHIAAAWMAVNASAESPLSSHYLVARAHHQQGRHLRLAAQCRAFPPADRQHRRLRLPGSVLCCRDAVLADGIGVRRRGRPQL